MKTRGSFYENNKKESKENFTSIHVLLACHYEYLIDEFTYS